MTLTAEQVEIRKLVPGMRFGRLTLVEKTLPVRGRARWVCSCECGESTTVHPNGIYNGNTRSCGCLQRDVARKTLRALKTTHGRSGTTEYRTWCAIIARCSNPNSPAYERYGGRGIRICEAWRGSFAAFLADVGERPSPRHSIDRIDNDGDYEPGNTRWATAVEQANNRRQRRWKKRPRRAVEC